MVKPESRSLSYGMGAVIIIALSLGASMIAYGSGFLIFSLFHLIAWILGPLGVFTMAYPLAGKKEKLYFLSWGSIMTAVAASSILYQIVNVVVVFGVLIIVIAIIALVAYMRRQR